MRTSPFYFPATFLFYFIYCPSDPFLYDIVRMLGSNSLIILISHNFLYYLYMAATSLCPLFLIPLLAVICLNVTSTSILCMSCIKYFLFLLVLVNWLLYFFPPNFIWRCLTTLPAFCLLGFVFVFSRYLVSI